ncbi:MAG: 30S ribosomal protein S16 [Verrucomicrobiota bacterium]
MSVRIRLRRVGKRNAPAHRIVVVDQRAPRDGKFIENLGSYNPRAKSESVDLERVNYWVSHGAQLSDTVAAIVKRAKAGMSWSGAQTAHHRKPADIKGKAAEEGAQTETEKPADATEAAEETVPESESAPTTEQADAEKAGDDASKSE